MLATNQRVSHAADHPGVFIMRSINSVLRRLWLIEAGHPTLLGEGLRSAA